MAMAASDAVPTPQDLQIGGILNAESAADGRAERHDGRGAGINQALGKNDVVGGISQNGESLFGQNARGFEGCLDIGIQCRLIANDFELDPIGKSYLAGETGGANGVVSGVAASGIGQKKVFARINVIQQRFFATVEVYAAHGDRDHVSATCFERSRSFLKRLVFTGPDDQTGTELPASDME
jgi:hypothetical protein